ncbi:MAG TPA: ABC transporter permease [Pyrinomonadaceae bacterium]|jgi:lipopolysaccharide transport system permease protein
MISAQDSRRLVWRPLWELPGRAELIRALVRRELAARYRGSALGVLWAMLTPAVMISIYTFIFAGIFGARFGERGTAWDYALYLFCALLPWTAFQDSLQVSSNVIVAHANLVKRVVFPLEALPVAQVMAALTTQMLGTIVLLLATLIIQRELHLTLLWLPVVVLPQLVLMLGAAWLVASLGVFLRDTGQVVSLLVVAWMFLTPIIYPEQIVPVRYQGFINANPFTPLVRNYRRIILEGVAPDWRGLAYFTLFALVVFILGYWWFAKTRKNFADVI